MNTLYRVFLSVIDMIGIMSERSFGAGEDL